MVLGLVLPLVKAYYLFLHPTHQTYKQIKGEGQNLKLWSYFWVMLSLFSLLEIISSEYIQMIPLYGWMKVLIFVWMYNQNLQGALLLGDKFKPVFQAIVQRTQIIQDKLQPFVQ